MMKNKDIIVRNLWVSSVLAIVISTIIIPVVLAFLPASFEVPNGTYVKSGSRVFYKFLRQVKRSNGVVILGTSETGNSLGGDNYWALLDRDKDLDRNFHAFGGAGRCAHVYFPLILDNPGAFKDLEVIYYINPTYWRVGLNAFHKAYFERYVDNGLVQSIKDEAKEAGIYEEFMNVGSEEAALPHKVDRIVESYRSLFYNDLNQLFEAKHPAKMREESIEAYYTPERLEAAKQEINPEYNATDEFLEQNIAFPMIDTASTFQYDALHAFIDLVEKYDIRCTFYLGPYNEIYCRQKNPKLLDEHEKTVEKIRAILEESGLPYIDGSEQSTIPGTFSDVQHISKYGAYLTALQIKEYYEKND